MADQGRPRGRGLTVMLEAMKKIQMLDSAPQSEDPSPEATPGPSIAPSVARTATGTTYSGIAGRGKIAQMLLAKQAVRPGGTTPASDVSPSVPASKSVQKGKGRGIMIWQSQYLAKPTPAPSKPAEDGDKMSAVEEVTEKMDESTISSTTTTLKSSVAKNKNFARTATGTTYSGIAGRGKIAQMLLAKQAVRPGGTTPASDVSSISVQKGKGRGIMIWQSQYLAKPTPAPSKPAEDGDKMSAVEEVTEKMDESTIGSTIPTLKSSVAKNKNFARTATGTTYSGIAGRGKIAQMLLAKQAVRPGAPGVAIISAERKIMADQGRPRGRGLTVMLEAMKKIQMLDSAPQSEDPSPEATPGPSIAPSVARTATGTTYSGIAGRGKIAQMLLAKQAVRPGGTTPASDVSPSVPASKSVQKGKGRGIMIWQSQYLAKPTPAPSKPAEDGDKMSAVEEVTEKMDESTISSTTTTLKSSVAKNKNFARTATGTTYSGIAGRGKIAQMLLAKQAVRPGGTTPASDVSSISVQKGKGRGIMIWQSQYLAKPTPAPSKPAEDGDKMSAVEEVTEKMDESTIGSTIPTLKSSVAKNKNFARTATGTTYSGIAGRGKIAQMLLAKQAVRPGAPGVAIISAERKIMADQGRPRGRGLTVMLEAMKKIQMLDSAPQSEDPSPEATPGPSIAPSVARTATGTTYSGIAGRGKIAQMLLAKQAVRPGGTTPTSVVSPSVPASKSVQKGKGRGIMIWQSQYLAKPTPAPSKPAEDGDKMSAVEEVTEKMDESTISSTTTTLKSSVAKNKNFARTATGTTYSGIAGRGKIAQMLLAKQAVRPGGTTPASDVSPISVQKGKGRGIMIWHSQYLAKPTPAPSKPAEDGDKMSAVEEVTEKMAEA